MRTNRLVAGMCALAAGVFATTGCTETILVDLKAEIHVDVCATDGVQDCSSGFGSIRQGGTQTIQIRITNPGEADLSINDIVFAQDTDPAFSLAGPVPSTVKMGELGETFTVQFHPAVATQYTAQLFIRSNAGNLKDGQNEVVVNLAGAGIDVGSPDLTVTPDACDFGEVGVGVAAFCDVSLGNNGTLELSINTAEFDPSSDPAFTVAGVFPVPFQLPPGSATTIRVQFRPTEARQYSGAIILSSTDTNHTTVTLPLTGSGGAAPTAVAKVLSINGQPNTQAAPQVHPLDNVILTGVDSVAGTPTRTITGYQWEIVSIPSGSTVVLTAPTARETGFQFNSSNVNRPGLDVAGTFVARLTVTDDSNATSSNDARVTLNAIPSENLHVQLTWTDATSDIDLHLVRGLGPRFSTVEDCYFANCKGANGLNWGGGQANPHLDVDDTNGFGPENINIQTPAAANYTVGVHWYSGSASTIQVTAKIYVQGALLGEFTRVMDRCKQYWEPARIIWGTTGTVSVDTVDTTTQATQGSCL